MEDQQPDLPPTSSEQHDSDPKNEELNQHDDVVDPGTESFEQFINPISEHDVKMEGNLSDVKNDENVASEVRDNQPVSISAPDNLPVIFENHDDLPVQSISASGNQPVTLIDSHDSLSLPISFSNEILSGFQSFTATPLPDPFISNPMESHIPSAVTSLSDQIDHITTSSEIPVVPTLFADSIASTAHEIPINVPEVFTAPNPAASVVTETPLHSSTVPVENLTKTVSTPSRQPLQPISSQKVKSSPDFVASFLDVNITLVSNLPQQLVESIAAHANEFEALKSQKILADVSYEQLEHSTQKQVNLIKAKLTDTIAESRELHSRNIELEQQKTALEKRIHEQIQNAENIGETAQGLQARIDAIVTEKMQTVEALERRNSEFADIRRELNDSRQKNSDNYKRIADLESKYQQARGEEVNAKLSKKVLQQQIDVLKSNCTFLETQLSEKTAQYDKFRKEKLEQISNNESELETIRLAKNSLEKSHDALKDRFSEISKDHDSALVQIKSLKDKYTVAEQDFGVEMASQKRLCQLWEQSAGDAKKRVEELESIIDRERSRDRSEVVSLQEEAQRERSRAERLERQLQSLEAELKDAHVAAEPAITQISGISTPVPRTPLRDPSHFSSGAVFSPSAQIISEIQKSGGSLVQLYSDFQDTKTRLQRERQKNEALRDEMDSILSEMEANAPTILAERAENQRLESELTELSMQLERSNKRVEDLENDLKKAQIDSQDKTRDAKILERQSTDLSRQVQLLLIQNQLLSESASIQLSPKEHEELQRLLLSEEINNSTVEEGDDTDTDKLISNRLVLFRNTIELQKKNEELLQVARQLGQQMEEKEKQDRKNLEQLESSAVSEAKDAILTLQNDIKTLETKSQALQKERDMFRRILSNKTGQSVDGDFSISEITSSSPSETQSLYVNQLTKQVEYAKDQLKETQQQSEAFKSETAITIKTLNQQIASLNSQQMDLKIQLSKSHSQLELATERFNNLSKNFDLVKVENDELKKRHQSMQENVAKQEERFRQVSDELVTVNSKSESALNEANNLKAEKSVWKSIEDRIKSENADLLQEKGRLNGLLQNLQSLEAEREAKESESRQTLNAQISSLEQSVTSLRDKLEHETSEVRRISMLREVESSEFHGRIEKLSADLTASRESLATLKSTHTSLEKQQGELVAQLKSSEEKLERLQLTKTQQEVESEESGLRSEIAALKKSLDDTQSELTLSREHQEQFKKLAEAAEESLNSMNSTLDEYKASMDGEIAKRESEIENLKAELSVNKEILSSTQEELSTLKSKESEKITEFTAENSKLRDQVNSLLSSEEILKQAQSHFKEDLERQSTFTRQAQENYEKELVNHAEAAKALQALRAEHFKLKESIQSLETKASQAENMLSDSQSSWDSQKDQYELDIAQMKARCVDLAKQNKLYLEQLESITKRESTSSPAKPGSQGDSENISSDTWESLSYLKHEKELADANNELLEQELKRVKMRLDFTLETLDATRVEIEKHKTKEADDIKNNTEHRKVLEQLNDLNILRESNTTLRSQSEFYSNKVKNLEEEASKLRATLEPLEEKLRVLSAESEVKDEQIRLAQEDSQKWQDRAQNIIQKYERIDPAELQRLKDSVESLTKDKTKLSDDLIAVTDSIKEHEAKVKVAEDSLAESKAQTATLQQRFDKLRNESIEKLSKRRGEVNSLREQLKNANNELTAAQKQVADLKAGSVEAASSAASNEEQAAKLASLNADLTQSKQAVEELQTRLSALVADKDKQIEELTTSNTKLLSDLSQKENELQKRIQELTAEKEKQIDELKTEKESKLQELSQEKDGRISVLENEINRLSDQELDLTAMVSAQKAIEAGSLDETVVSLTKEKSALEQRISELEKKVPTVDQIPDEIQKKFIADAEANATEKLKIGSQAQLEEQIKKKREELESQFREREKELEKSYNDKIEAASSQMVGGSELGTLQKIREKLQKDNAEALAKQEEDYKKKLANFEKETSFRMKLLQSKADKAMKDKDALVNELEQFKAQGGTVTAPDVSTAIQSGTATPASETQEPSQSAIPQGPRTASLTAQASQASQAPQAALPLAGNAAGKHQLARPTGAVAGAAGRHVAHPTKNPIQQVKSIVQGAVPRAPNASATVQHAANAATTGTVPTAAGSRLPTRGGRGGRGGLQRPQVNRPVKRPAQQPNLTAGAQAGKAGNGGNAANAAAAAGKRQLEQPNTNPNDAKRHKEDQAS